MRHHGRILGAVLLAVGLLGASTIGASADDSGSGGSHAVFVQTDNANGNQILAYHRANDGTLTFSASYDTLGKGAKEVGAPVDPLASQSSLVYDPDHALLYSVNSGSDTISVFGVSGDRLSLRQVLWSGGQFPSSITANHDLVYVLNAGGAGNVYGYHVDGGRLSPIAGSSRSLGLNNTNPPAFLTAPAQVALTPDGDNLVVTTKGNNTIDVFRVKGHGLLSDAPYVNQSAGPVPFGFTFDSKSRLVVTEVGPNAVSTYEVHNSGVLEPVSTSVKDNQAAACWIAFANGTFYVANAGSSTLSAYQVDNHGVASLTNPVAAHTSGGPIDLAATPDGKYLYSQNSAAGTVDEFRVQSDGSLVSIGRITGLPQVSGMEGIVAL